MDIIHQILIESVVNRFLRHWGIRKHGYPPYYCTADGDFRDDADGDFRDDTEDSDE